jgi:hypothetical protein
MGNVSRPASELNGNAENAVPMFLMFLVWLSVAIDPGLQVVSHVSAVTQTQSNC